MISKKQTALALAVIFILIGCIGTFAKEPGIYTAFFMLGIVFLILGSAIKIK